MRSSGRAVFYSKVFISLVAAGWLALHFDREVSAATTIKIRIPAVSMGTWNMQGASSNGENKYAAAAAMMNAFYNNQKLQMERKNVVGLKEYDEMEPLDVLALQEAGAVPGSAVYSGFSAPAGCRGNPAIEDCASEYRYNGFYLYHMPVDSDEVGKRTNLAILSRQRASELVIHPRVRNENTNQTLANRAVMGILYETGEKVSTYFYTLHAGSFGQNAEHHNNVDPALRAISRYHSQDANGNSPDGKAGRYQFGWAVAGDYNRDPRNTPTGVIEGVMNTWQWGYQPTRVNGSIDAYWVYSPNMGTKSNNADRMIDYIVSPSTLWGFTGWRVPTIASLSDHMPVVVQGFLKASADAQEVESYRNNLTTCANIRNNSGNIVTDYTDHCKYNVEKRANWKKWIPIFGAQYAGIDDYRTADAMTSVTCKHLPNIEGSRPGIETIVGAQLNELTTGSSCPIADGGPATAATEIAHDTYKADDDGLRRRLLHDDDHGAFASHGFQKTKIDNENVFIRKNSNESNALITTLWSTGRSSDPGQNGRLDKVMVQVPYQYKNGMPLAYLALNYDIVGGAIRNDSVTDGFRTELLSKFGLSQAAVDAQLAVASKALLDAKEHALENGIPVDNIDIPPGGSVNYYIWVPTIANTLHAMASGMKQTDFPVRVRVYDQSTGQLKCDAQSDQGYVTYCHPSVTGGRHYRIEIYSAHGVYNSWLQATYLPAKPGIDPSPVVIPNISAWKGGSYVHTVYYYNDGTPGTKTLRLRTYGGSGKVTLYARKGSHVPTSTSYDCRSIGTGTSTSCSVSNPGGLVSILVVATENISGVTLEASN